MGQGYNEEAEFELILSVSFVNPICDKLIILDSLWDSYIFVDGNWQITHSITVYVCGFSCVFVHVIMINYTMSWYEGCRNTSLTNLAVFIGTNTSLTNLAVFKDLVQLHELYLAFCQSKLVFL